MLCPLPSALPSFARLESSLGSTNRRFVEGVVGTLRCLTRRSLREREEFVPAVAGDREEASGTGLTLRSLRERVEAVPGVVGDLIGVSGTGISASEAPGTPGLS